MNKPIGLITTAVAAGAIAAVVLSGCTSGHEAAHTPTPTTVSHSTPTTTTTIAASSSDARSVSFETPSRNIHCTVIAGDQLTCDLDTESYRASPRPSSCTLNWLGSTIVLSSSGATRGVCAGNPVVQSSRATLAYGHRLRVGSITCDSTAAALVCTSGKHGFTLSRQAAVLH